MKRLYRDNVAFAYEDVGSGSQPFLFVHGWTCNHKFFAPQIEYFSRLHRVIAVDLCGHGASDAPQRQYTVPEFADDLSWLCGELGLKRAVLVGHSMGGVIALQLAATHPELSAAVCLIDSVAFPSDAFIAQLKLLGDQLAGATYIQTLQLAAGALFIETDDPVRKVHVLTEMAKTSQHVAVPAFRNHLLDYDASPAARACRVPIAYIAASNLIADLGQFKQLCPQLVTAQTLGSGHFSPLEVPEQVNTMLERFVKISLPQDRGHAASAFRDGGSLKSGTKPLGESQTRAEGSLLAHNTNHEEEKKCKLNQVITLISKCLTLLACSFNSLLHPKKSEMRFASFAAQCRRELWSHCTNTQR
jgi:pimeloyl-ACP methyl ester carboxylesterase